MAFSPDSALLAAADGTVLLWQLSSLSLPAEIDQSVIDDLDGADSSTWKQLATLQGDGAGVQAVAFSPDGTMLASGDDTVILWDVAKQKHALGHMGNVVAFSPDGTMPAGVAVVLWDVASRSSGTP